LLHRFALRYRTAGTILRIMDHVNTMLRSRREVSVRPALLLSELFPPAIGGSAVLFEAVYSRFRDVPVTVLTDRQVSPDDGVSRPGVRLVRDAIATRHWGVLEWRGLVNHLRVGRLLRRLEPRAIVHCGRVMPEGVAAWLNHGTGGAPYVCWAHGEEINTASTSRELMFLARRVYQGALLNIANSHNTARMLESCGVRPSAIRVVHPGVDLERFHPGVDGARLRAAHARTGELVLLTVGRLQRRKNHALVVEAMALMPDVPIRYLIAGDGEERHALEALVATHGLGDRVTFLGAVPGSDLPALYAACDLFVMPNRLVHGDLEGFGIVFLEAAAVGRPAIGGTTGGVPEAVEDGRTGLLVEGTDAGELARAIRSMMSPARRSEMGAAACARAAAFNWDRAARDVEAIHRELDARLR
jgi:phosphatidylinositol alpha-1,6-mannosyltransferase